MTSDEQQVTREEEEPEEEEDEEEDTSVSLYDYLLLSLLAYLSPYKEEEGVGSIHHRTPASHLQNTAQQQECSCCQKPLTMVHWTCSECSSPPVLLCSQCVNR